MVATDEALPRKDKVGGGEVALPTGPASRKGRDLEEEEGSLRALPRSSWRWWRWPSSPGRSSRSRPRRVRVPRGDRRPHPRGLVVTRRRRRRQEGARRDGHRHGRSGPRPPLDELATSTLHPHARKPLTTYAALVEFEGELRFGKDNARAAARAAWLEISPRPRAASPRTSRTSPWPAPALTASNGDFAGARTTLDMASKKDVGAIPSSRTSRLRAASSSWPRETRRRPWRRSRRRCSSPRARAPTSGSRGATRWPTPS